MNPRPKCKMKMTRMPMKKVTVMWGQPVTPQVKKSMGRTVVSVALLFLSLWKITGKCPFPVLPLRNCAICSERSSLFINGQQTNGR